MRIEYDIHNNGVLPLPSHPIPPVFTLTVTGASTLCTFPSSTSISLARRQSALTSHSLRYSHRLSLSICESRDDDENDAFWLMPPPPPLLLAATVEDCWAVCCCWEEEEGGATRGGGGEWRSLLDNDIDDDIEYDDDDDDAPSDVDATEGESLVVDDMVRAGRRGGRAVDGGGWVCKYYGPRGDRCSRRAGGGGRRLGRTRWRHRNETPAPNEDDGREEKERESIVRRTYQLKGGFRTSVSTLRYGT
jgi:hypothetical protein